MSDNVQSEPSDQFQGLFERFCGGPIVQLLCSKARGKLQQELQRIQHEQPQEMT